MLAKDVKIVAITLGILVLLSSSISSVRADITLGTPNEFLNPLGTYHSWSFESTGYWSSNYGGYRSSSYKLHQSYSWRTTGTSSGNYRMWRYVQSSCLNAIKGKNAMFAFSFLPSTYNSEGSINNARAVVTVYTSSGSYTYYGKWIKPVEFKWHNAHVNAYVSSYATSVKVMIEGSTSFRVYVDVASFSIRDSMSHTSSKGKLAFDVNLYEWRIMQGAEYDGRVFISTALFAEGASGYYIRAIKLYVELLPLETYWSWWPPGWFTRTTQKGQLDIEYLGQANNKGHEVDPGATEEFQNRVLEAAEITLDFGVGVGLATIPVSGPVGIILVAATQTGMVTGAKWLLQHFASDPNDRQALGGNDYSVHEQWGYPTYYKEYQSRPFVSAATGHYQLEWIFDTDTASNFKIRIKADVNWGVAHYHPGSPYTGIGYYTLDDAGWESLSTTVTVNA